MRFRAKLERDKFSRLYEHINILGEMGAKNAVVHFSADQCKFCALTVSAIDMLSSSSMHFVRAGLKLSLCLIHCA
jgi:hypothetical protein